MRASRYFLATLKEAPADAELVSHKLMIRAGLIRRLAGGIYTWMPLGLRIVRKVEAIVREEMNRAGAIELFMPAVQPAELWQESGRWQKYGPELLRLKDRHEREFCVGPTHEEVITDIARREIRSYRQLPVHFYQIQTKFRDEIRPRFGVMRGREFTMKDGYSFHADYTDLQREYRNMHDTYTRIFTRLGLKFRAVAADPGSIGGTGSHEFHVLAESGEDAIAYCPQSDYAANVELAEAVAPKAERKAPAAEMKKVPTPGKTRCEDVAELLGVPIEKTVKAIAVVREEAQEGASGAFVMLLVRGDHDLNEIKTQKVIGNFRFARDDEIERTLKTRPGYIGPVSSARLSLYADRTVAAMSDFVCGANEAGYHFTGANWGRDLPEPGQIADIRKVTAGDLSPDGKGNLEIVRGIEVGHIFQLRTKYSEAMKAAFLDEAGNSRVFEMGCYGIGITRIVGAAIEQNHDERGIVFPEPIAPFHVGLIPIGYGKSAAVRDAADAIYGELSDSGVEVLLDDRDERPGVMFADMELIGIPHRVVVGERGLKEGLIEYQGRRDREPRKLPRADVLSRLRSKS
ncbi:MAG TPA: proline--tRNA ligase [Burkholderiales bacterium]